MLVVRPAAPRRDTVWLMVTSLSRVATLLFAVSILLIGHGLQLTLLPVHALSLGWSSTQIGITGSLYFVGFVTGCIVVPGIVSSVGHIRSFMVMAAVATVALLLAALLVNVWAWLLLRFATGVALAGLYMIVESWLADVCPKNQRGTVLSVYLAVSLIGMAVGQLPMMLLTPGDTRLFILAGAFLAIAIIPVGLTRVASPKPIPTVRVTPRTLMRASRVAVVCAFIAGTVLGTFWTLAPVAGRAFGLSQGEVGLMIGVGVLGGAASQYPVGLLSDFSDRRLVIAAMTMAGAAVSGFGAVFADSSMVVLYGAIFMLCATTMPVYALCIALAADKTELSLVELTGGILLAHGFGSIVGPILASIPMNRIGPNMFFAFCSACLVVAAIWTVYRYLVAQRPVGHEASRPMLPKTTQAVAFMLDSEEPRAGQLEI
jgi:MFS family permease